MNTPSTTASMANITASALYLAFPTFPGFVAGMAFLFVMIFGMLFYNDENTEVGGLTMTGHRDADGQVHQVVHLSMDRYEQDQVIALNHHESPEVYRAGLTINDRGTGSLADADVPGDQTARRRGGRRRGRT